VNGSALARYLPGLQENLRERLRKDGVDPASEDAQRLCPPLGNDAPMTIGDVAPATREGGRPPDELRNAAIQLAVKGLGDAGVSITRACELLERGFLVLFGTEIDAATLERQYRRLRKGARQGKAARGPESKRTKPGRRI
jgi:hypothetical protein